MTIKVQRILWVVLCGAASANVFQMFTVAHSTSTLTRISHDGQLSQGVTVPSMVALTKDGVPAVVIPDQPAKPILLYWMSPDCVWCAKNEANFRALVSRISQRFDCLAVSASLLHLRDHLEETRPPYPVWGPPNLADVVAYHLGATPTTVVISTERQVLRVWNGVYEGTIRTDVEHFFDLKTPLPGLVSTSH